MKLLIILLLTILVTSSLAHRKLEWKSIANKEEYLKKLNDFRRDYAKKSTIPNMYKLYWDDHLESKAHAVDRSGDRKTERMCSRDGNDFAEKHKQAIRKNWFPFERRGELIEQMKTQMDGMEDLTPGQQKIGCVPSKQTLKYENNDYVHETLCFLGPDGSGESWRHPQGEPGSACDKGFENDDGLCAPIAKSDEKSGNSGSSAAETPKESSESPTSGGEPRGNYELFSMILLMILNFVL